MKSDDIKHKMIEAIPYAAVFGIAAFAVYGITKIVQSLDDMDIPLDWGQDAYLTELSKNSRED
jgi:purine nucleoside permease